MHEEFSSNENLLAQSETEMTIVRQQRRNKQSSLVELFIMYLETLERLDFVIWVGSSGVSIF